MPSPCVMVRNCVRKPKRARAGISNSTRVREPCGSTSTSWPLRPESTPMTVEANRSGTSITRCSKGSYFLPSTSRTITRGAPTWTSYPSRRMVSRRIERCNSPRPETSNSARRDEPAFFPREGGGARAEGHADRRFVDADRGQGLRFGLVGYGLPDLRVLDAGEGHDVAGADLLGLDAPQPEVREGLDHARTRHRAVLVDQIDELPAPYLAPSHAPDHDAPEVLGVVQVGDEHLERRREIHLRSRDLRQHRLEELPHVITRLVQVSESPALAGHGVQDGEIQLLVGGAEVGHQVEGEVHYLVGAGVRAVHLVDDHDGLEVELDGLAQHEARLGHRAFGGVDEQEAAVHHAEDALDLAAEVRVARGVDDVDLDALVFHSRVLGQYGYAPLPLQHVGVHGAIGDLLPVPELQGLPEQPVHERGLAVIDVRDYGDVAILQTFSRHTFLAAGEK